MRTLASRRWEWIVVLLTSSIKLWLTEAWSLAALGWLTFDDYWFLKAARSILQGQWLGSYGHVTLIKGPGYPLWIAFVSSLRIPLLFAQQLLYVLACLAVYRAFTPSLRNSIARISLFVVLLFNPMTFSARIASRVIREGIYPALTLLVIAGLIGAVLRLDTPRREILPWTLLGSVALAMFWHTREEGVWILPILGCVVVVVLAWISVDRRSRWPRGALVLVTPALILALSHVAILVTNGLKYGAFAVVDVKQAAFLHAYGALTHVHRADTGTPEPASRVRVPVPKEVRERVYRVSPAFAELRPYLEGTVGENWTRNSGAEGDGDIGGGAFQWALRDAVSDAGYYDRGARAVEEYYSRLGREIDAARRAGRLDADPASASMLPPLRPGQMRDVVRKWIQGCFRLPALAGFSTQPIGSKGSPAELREFAEVTRSPLAHTTTISQMHLKGWVLHVDGALEIAIQRADRSPAPNARVIRLPSEDLYEHLKTTWKPFPPARHARFELWAEPGDAVVLSRKGTEVERMPLTEGGLIPHHPDVRLSVESIRIETRRMPMRPLDGVRLRVLQEIGRAYQLTFSAAVVLAGLLYCSNLLWLARQRRDWMTPLLIAGLLATIAFRMLILSLIDVTSFDALIDVYQAPAYPLLMLVCVLCANDALTALRGRLRGPAGAAPQKSAGS